MAELVTDDQRYNELLEQFCLAGCDRVRAIIVALQRGELVEPMHPVDRKYSEKLSLELQQIMAVYDQR